MIMVHYMEKSLKKKKKTLVKAKQLQPAIELKLETSLI